MGQPYYLLFDPVICLLDFHVFLCFTDPDKKKKERMKKEIRQIQAEGNNIWKLMRMGRENSHHGTVVVCCHLLADCGNRLSRVTLQTVDCKCCWGYFLVSRLPLC